MHYIVIINIILLSCHLYMFVFTLCTCNTKSRLSLLYLLNYLLACYTFAYYYFLCWRQFDPLGCRCDVKKLIYLRLLQKADTHMAMSAESMDSKEWLSTHSVDKAGLTLKELMDKGQIAQQVAPLLDPSMVYQRFSMGGRGWWRFEDLQGELNSGQYLEQYAIFKCYKLI